MQEKSKYPPIVSEIFKILDGIPVDEQNEILTAVASCLIDQRRVWIEDCKRKIEVTHQEIKEQQEQIEWINNSIKKLATGSGLSAPNPNCPADFDDVFTKRLLPFEQFQGRLNK